MGVSSTDAIKEICRGIETKNIDAVEMAWISILHKYGHEVKNLTAGGEGFKGFTPEILEKIRLKRIGSTRSTETKNRISIARKGIIFSDEHKANLCMARRGRKTTLYTRLVCSQTSKGKINIKKYLCISPEGEQHVTNQGLVKFCEEHNLSPQNMHKVLKGKRSNHKGWTIRNII
jgi:hypothetical protein